MSKRIRIPEPKADTLTVSWGREYPYAIPSLVYTYPDRDGRCDIRILMDAIERPRFERTFDGYKELPSLAAELEARGYDLTTLKFSVKRKKVEQKED